jgi:hypothetical protein
MNPTDPLVAVAVPLQNAARLAAARRSVVSRGADSDTTLPVPLSGRLTLFCLYTAILYASFVHDVFRVVGPFREGHIGYDSNLVLTRLQLAKDGKVGFWAPLGGYWSQLGLQGVCLSAVLQATGLEPVGFAYLAAKVFSLLTAMLLGAFFVSIARAFGTFAAGVGVLLTALSPVLLEMAPSVFWASFLCYAPFVVVWLVDPWLTRRARGGVARLGLVFGLVFLKALCGYEFITTVILSPIAAVFYHRFREGRLGWRFAGLTVAIVAAGVAGFGSALTLHAAQLDRVQDVRDQFGGGWGFIRLRAKMRIADDPNAELFDRSIQGTFWGLTKPVTPLTCFLHYFRLPAANLPQTFPAIHSKFKVKLYYVVVYALAAAVIALAAGDRLPRPARALAYAAVIGLATGLSWQVAAVNHMCVHFHLNRIVFHLPFLPLAYAGVGWTVGQALALVGWETRAAGALFPAVLMLAVLGSVVGKDFSAHRQEIDKGIWSHVRTHIEAGRPNDGKLQGVIEAVEHVSNDGDTEIGRSAMVGPHPSACSVWLVSGWAVDTAVPPRPGPWLDVAYPRPSFVVTQGRHAVPFRAKHYRRYDVNMALRLNDADAGFQLFILCRHIEEDQPLRVFIVSGTDQSRVRELPVPGRIVAR